MGMGALVRVVFFAKRIHDHDDARPHDVDPSQTIARGERYATEVAGERRYRTELALTLFPCAGLGEEMKIKIGECFMSHNKKDRDGKNMD